MKTIKGSTNPKAEEKTFYELSDFVYHFENPLFGKKENEKHIWTLYKQVNNNWKQVSGNIKYGEKVPYTFGEKAVGISFKIEVHTESKNILNKIEKKLTASLVVVPRTKHEPVIGRVILLNRDNADVNKATFNESLSAEARTSNLVGKEITFYLWEEGATEEKKYQKPKTAKVDKNGIAKIKFSLSEYATPQTWMSFFSGNHNTTKKFFVSASYLSKETTNKTPVSVTESQQQQPQQQTEKKEESTGFIEKATNIIAEGIGKIGDYVEEKTRTATSVGGNATRQPGTCICQEQYKDLIWGGKVSCEFRKKVVQICAELWGESRKIEMANGLMAVMKVETWGSFKAHHREGFQSANDSPKDLTISSFHKDSGSKSSRAVGLIQFTQDALEGMNEFPKSTPATKGTQPRYDALNRLKLGYAQMGEIRQLDKVKKYFEPAKNKIKTPEDIYLHVFAPKGVGQKDDFLLYEKDTIEYKNNKSVDKDNNGIQRKEILARFYKSKMDGINNKTSKFTCRIDDKKIDTINATDIVTYHIYADGKIEKHIPKEIKSGYEQKYKYVFHDKENKEHEICVVDYIFANKRNNGITISSIPRGYTETYSYPRGGNAQTAYVYSNGDICVEGTRYGFKKYPKGTGKVELVRMKDSLSYNNGNVKIYYSFKNSQRRHCNPESYAGFIGALATLGRTDVLCTGMCFEDATSYPSVTHPNGDSADTAYYSTLALEQKKVNAFKHFNFKNIYRGQTRWYPNLIGTKYSRGHEDHLHAGDFDSSIVKTIKE
ncbi:hypothetical protein BA768_00940 [Chryseobacterium sp. CBo1]|uniref:hypothetical protein n=1 Tax=Chryseobacterium sp. CBo1 TaxID=1869230 RepID=UPI000810430F|nr:hypothetical protein [Chryseobacterium sp. CBo1]OCK53154.1 hypothetical protein BA768_00940 [Chryseobacterium sp. CBo1]